MKGNDVQQTRHYRQAAKLQWRVYRRLAVQTAIPWLSWRRHHLREQRSAGCPVGQRQGLAFHSGFGKATEEKASDSWKGECLSALLPQARTHRTSHSSQFQAVAHRTLSAICCTGMSLGPRLNVQIMFRYRNAC
jgi:hypothetical protein